MLHESSRKDVRRIGDASCFDAGKCLMLGVEMYIVCRMSGEVSCV
jgi:hypothetical protein